MSHYNEGLEPPTPREHAEKALVASMADRQYDVVFLRPVFRAPRHKPRPALYGCRLCGAAVYQPSQHDQFCPDRP